MKMIKRTLCLLLSFIMVIGMFPMQAFATGEGLEILNASPIQELPVLEPVPAAEPLLPELPPVPELIPEPLPESGMDGAAALLPDAAPAPVVTAAAVYFNCDPAQLSLYVYDGYGVPAVPQADGAYLLAPGSYVYFAYAEGYVSAENCPLLVAEGVASLTVDVVLQPETGEEISQPDGDESAQPEEALPDGEEIFTEVFFASFNGAAAAVDSEGNLLIDENNFPDAAFRAYISESYDTAKTGKLSAAQVADITDMNVTGLGIVSMAGVEHFTALTELVCSYNSITELDVSRSSALITLDCSSNSLTGLDVSNNPALTTLVCGGNMLSDLDLSACTGLVRLECDRNSLNALDLSANLALEGLNCSSNKLSALDLSANTALAELSCDNNRLATLDLSANTGLYFAYCGNHSPQLNAYWENGKLLYNMSALVGGKLANVHVEDAPYDESTGIVTLCDPAVSANISTEFSYVIDITAGSGAQTVLNAYATVQVPEQPGTVKINETNFPDAAFRAYVSSSFDKNGTGLLLPGQIAAITSIDCSNMGIANLKGVELFTALKTLHCDSNSISYVDLSALSALERVSASGQQISAAALWTGDKLSFDLGALVGAENKALPTGISGLEGVSASYSSESGLVTLDIIPADNVSSAGFKYQISFGTRGSADVTVSLSVPAYEGDKLLIDEASFPDAAFRGYISGSLDTAGLGYLTASQLDAVSVMDCSNMGIASLKGIENFKNLTELVCSYNALSALELSANTALLTLDCSGNSLTALDLSANTALTTLECSGNSLNALDLSANTALSSVKCADNALTAINISGCTKLSTLDCSENALTELELSTNTALRALWCSNNKLESLKLGSCAALVELYCADNILSALDVSACVNLRTLHCDRNALVRLDVSANAALADLSCSYQESERNAFWKGDDLYFDLAALVGTANLEKISNVSVERYDAVNGLVTVQLAEDKAYVSEFSYDYAVNDSNTMSVSIHVLRPEKPVGGSCGENTSWIFDPADGSITVSGSGDMEDYTAGGAPWDEYKDKIGSITIDSGVTGIADNAFAGFSNVSSVVLPEGITSIGDGAFAGMSSLESINIPASVTSIGSGAFDGCTALEEISFNSDSAPACDWAALGELEATVYFPDTAVNDSWLDSMEAYEASGDTGLTWRVAGTTTYGEHLKALTEKYKGSKERTVSVAEDAYVPAGISVSEKLRLVVEDDVSLELKGQLTIKGSAQILGSVTASNISVEGSLDMAPGSSLTADTLIVKGALGNKGGSIKVKNLLRIDAGANISIDSAANLDAAGATVNNPNGILIKVKGADYTEPSQAVSENLYSHIDYTGAQPATDEELAALLAVTVAKMDISIASDMKLTADARIAANVSVTVGSGSLSTDGFALEIMGSLTLMGDLKVNGGSVTNKGSITLAGGSVYKDEAGALYNSAPGRLDYAEGFSLRLEDLNDLIALGLKNITLKDGEYALDWDMTIPSDVELLLDSAALSIGEGVRLIRLGSKNIVLRNGAVLTIIGAYDGPEIAVYKGEGCQVIPPEGLDCVERVSGDITYVSVGVPMVESLEICDAEGNVISGGELFRVDMSEGIYYQLKVKVEPANASNRVKWSSNTTTVATVSETGLVTFLKPGTVSITATSEDGSKKTATVNMEVVFAGIDSKTKFTAALAAESCGYVDEETGMGQPLSIGLQKGDSVEMLIYGTDKTSPLPASLFTYEPANTASAKYVKVDDNGIITALEAGGSASIKASFKDDPLRRSVTVTVKTIPVQTKKDSIKVIPDLMLAEVMGVDYNGNICAPGEDAKSYAIFVDKVPAGTPAAQLPSFVVRLEVMGADGELMYKEPGEIKGKHTWASTGTNIATVKENADGTATITIKANVDGACTITATTKDATKEQGHIAVYVRDYAPRLEAASLTIDSQKTGEVSLGVVESYDAVIETVEYLDKYDSKTKTYSSSGDVVVSHFRLGSSDSGDGFEEVVLRFETTKYIKNGTLNGCLRFTLSVPGETTQRSCDVPFKLTVKNTAPAVTVKQLNKFNLFCTDSVSNYSFTVKNETVTGVTLESSDFVGSWDGEKLSVSYKDPLNIPAKPNTKATFKITLDGYRNSVEKAVTIGTANTKPVLTLEPASLAIYDNGALPEVNTFSVLLREKSGIVLELGEGEVNLVSGPAGFVPVGEGQYISFNVSRADIEALKSGKVSFTVQDGNWTAPVTVNLSISKTVAAPTAKLAKTTLKLNSAYAETSDETTLSLSYANMRLDELGVAVEAVKGSDGLNVVYENGRLSAGIREGQMVAAGNYSYKLVFADETIKPISFTVNVVSAPPAAKLSKTTANLSAGYVAREDVVTALPVTAGHSVKTIVEPIEIKSTGAAAAEAAKIDFRVESDTITVSIHDKDKTNLPKAGSYTYTVNTILNTGTGEAVAKPLTLTVKVAGDNPTAKLSKTSLALNTAFPDYQESLQVIPTKAQHSIITFNVEPKVTTTNAAEIEKIGFSYDLAGNTITFRIKDEYKADPPKAGSYSFTVSGDLSTELGEGAFKPLTLTVKVASTVPKVTLSSSTLNLNTAAGLAGKESGVLSIVAPVGYEVARTVVERVDTNELTQEHSKKISIDEEFDSGIISASLNEGDLPKAGTYKFKATPWVRAIGDEGEGMKLAAMSFNIKVYANTKEPAAAVSGSGKLDTTKRDSFITYSLTKLTNISGEVLSVALDGQDAAKFAVGATAGGQFTEGAVGLNAKGQTTAELHLKDGESYATNVTYKLRLAFTLKGVDDSEHTVLTPVLSVKLTSTPLKLAVVTKQQSIFQSQSRMRTVYYTVKFNGPEGVNISNVIETGSTGLLRLSLVDYASNIRFVQSAEGIVDSEGNMTIAVTIKDTSKLNANKTYTLPLLINVEGGAVNAATKLNLTLKVFK